MLIIDKKFEYKDRTKLLASQAAVNGFSILAKKLILHYIVMVK